MSFFSIVYFVKHFSLLHMLRSKKNLTIFFFCNLFLADDKKKKYLAKRSSVIQLHSFYAKAIKFFLLLSQSKFSTRQTLWCKFQQFDASTITSSFHSPWVSLLYYPIMSYNLECTRKEKRERHLDVVHKTRKSARYYLWAIF